MADLVSIIMPVYNAEKYVGEAVQSVMNQTHMHWELLIINDGSTDNSQSIIDPFDDVRIKKFKQENTGVSAARNVGLRNMSGEFFCFLDADDILTPNSLACRMAVFKQNPDLSFVDGTVEKWNGDFSKKLSTWIPRFTGNPLEDLVNLTGRSFFGPSWMVRREPTQDYLMEEGLTHGEDLLFYITHSTQNKLYGFTNDCTLKYRVHGHSAMSNLNGLGQGYLDLEGKLVRLGISDDLVNRFGKKRKSIMFKTYLRTGRLYAAISYYFKPDRV